MPLDFAGQRFSLVDQVRMLGVEPVSDAVFEQHKITETKRWPGSFGYRHPNMFNIGFWAMFVASFMGIFDGMITSTAFMYVPSFFLFFGQVIWAILNMDRKLNFVFKGPAWWRERSTLLIFEVPNEIFLTARLLAKEIPGSHFVIGELWQDTKLVDPYLLLCVGDLQVCLCIWDDTRIIHRAKIL